MDQGFPLFRALGEEARAEMNRKRNDIRKAERLNWEIGRDHCKALMEDRLRHIKAIRTKTAKVNAVLKDGKVTSLKAFERLMLKGAK